MFSHYEPQLFASVGSTLVIGVCMCGCDWRMALAVLWVVPVAVALTAGSKKIQDAFGTKNILNKRAVAACIQEGLETVRDIKACHRQERYLGDLEAKLSAMEGSSIRSELATGVFVCSAQAFLRLGLATTVLTGGALLLAGELSFLYFLGFLFAAARLYDPLGVVLQNIAATFNTKLQIERMRSILEQPVQTVETEDGAPCTLEERLMLGLRLTEGVPAAWLAEKKAAVERYCKLGFLRRTGDPNSLRWYARLPRRRAAAI